MSESRSPDSAADPSGQVRAGETLAETVRALVLALASNEDKLRQLEAWALDDRSPGWAERRTALAERERIIVESLHDHGVPFTSHLHTAGVVERADGPAGQTGSDPATYAAPMPNQSSQKDDIAAAQEIISHLQDGLHTRNVIGQAQGILMERHRLSAEDAFTRLRICSQLLNRKLRDVARDLARTGEEPLPDVLLDERAAREQQPSGARGVE
ncbi:MAG TPA: ANTAR domain-containing protein [Pedococcus sp.]|jgi:hypothetical protein|nr:ANTAR domain-containing protein [Pedococcus sp.]